MMRNNVPKRPQHRRNPNQRRPQHSKNYQGGGFNQNQNQIDLNALDAEQRLDYRPPRNRTVLQQNVDKFLNQAREALSTGDRALSENYLQHADHFNRLLNEQKDMQKQNDIQRTQQREQTVQNTQQGTDHQQEDSADKQEEPKAKSPEKPAKKTPPNQLDAAILPDAIQADPVAKPKPVKKAAVRRTPRKKPILEDAVKEDIAMNVEPAPQEPEGSQ